MVLQGCPPGSEIAHSSPATQRVRGDRKWTAGLSGAKDGGGDAQPGGGAGVAGLGFGVGDLAGDGAELGGDRRLGRGAAFEGVEDLVVLAAARGEHGDDVLDAGALDVGDVGLDRRTRRAGAGGASDALLRPLGSHGRSRCTSTEAVWRLWPSWPIRDRHNTGNSRVQKRRLSSSKSAALVEPSPTWASTPWRSRSVWASWRRQRTRSANTITCSSPTTPAIVWAAIPRSSGSPSPPPRIASPTSPWRLRALASAAFECSSVSGSTEASR